MNWLETILRDPTGRKWPTLVVIMMSRLLLLGLLLVALASILPGDDISGGYGIGAILGIAFIVTILCSFWLKNGNDAVFASGPAQFVVDVLVITGIVHFTGGINSQMIILYPLVILAAGMVFSGRHAALVAVLGIIMYSALVVLELNGVLFYCGSDLTPYGNTPDVIRRLMLCILVFSFFAGAAVFITDRYFWQDAQLRRLQSVGHLIFDRVTAPLLAVRLDGTVVLANSVAAKLFGLDSSATDGMKLSALFVAAMPPLNDLGKTHAIWEMRRKDGTSLQCMIEAQLVEMPELTEGSFLAAQKDKLYHFVVFTDLTAVIKAENSQRTRQRLQTAAGMVAEMAHEVRNPLTAIKSAGELLSETAATVATERRDISSGDWAMINSICTVISDETARLDKRVQYLMDCAAKEPDKLLEISKHADDWMERLPLYGKREKNETGSDC